MQERKLAVGRPTTIKSSFWKNRPVLITGVTGFAGSALAARLVSLKAHVVGLAKENPNGSTFNRLGLRRQVRCVWARLEDAPALEHAVRRHAVQIVYHLGAQAIVGLANRSPLPTFTANVQGTWNLLEACRGKKSIRAVVVASSDKAYGSHKKLPYREEFPLQPQYPYDVSKACADLIARSYFHTYGLPVVVTRFANLYGPGDLNFSRIVPESVRSILSGKHPVIRSDGTPERDYLYIDDAIDLYLLLAERIQKTRGQVFNAGNSRPISVSRLVTLLLRLAGRPDLKPRILGKGTPHGEIDRQWLDGGKAHRLLGWRPKIGLEEGLGKALAWYRDRLPARP